MKAVIGIFVAFFIILSFTPDILPETPTKIFTHSVLCEEGTATWCEPCVAAGETLYSIYESGAYPFYFVAFVTDKDTNASERLTTDYNALGYPTLFFDGGYRIEFGSPSSEEPYKEMIEECLARASIKDIDMTLLATWDGNGLINITITIKNDENENYSGRLRIYVTEITSRWMMKNGQPYHFAFLDYAVNENVSIHARGTYNNAISWNGTLEGFEDIMGDNIMVIAALFNSEKHQGYASPPSSNPFDAYYVDQTIATTLRIDSPPQVIIVQGPSGISGYKNATFQWEGNDDTTPLEEILYSYMLKRADSSGGGIWSDWSFNTNVTFTGLENGTYLFQVKAKDEKNQESFLPSQRNFSVDTSPPKPKLITPFNEAENVPVYSDITLEFSHEMDRTSVEDAIKIDPPIQYETQWNKNMITLKPVENLDYLTYYSIMIKGDARRPSGQSMGESYLFSFTTASEDVIPPSVISTYPLDGAENVSTATNITIIFSEPMDRAYTRRALQIQPWFSHRMIWGDNDTSLTLEPLELTVGKYSIMILGIAKDKAENNLTSPYLFHFETRRPQVVYTIPADDEQNVSVSTEICLYFSEKMDILSLNDAILITPSVDFIVVENGTMITLDIPQLEYYKRYVITVGGDAANIRGTTMKATYTMSFITQAKVDENHHPIPSFLGVTAVTGIVFIFLVKRRRENCKE